ncbi:MAG: GTPase HflX [Clostridium sp.]|nr:GTPase HflX [Clostridium sp.]
MREKVDEAYEKALLVGADCGTDREAFERSMKEMESLAEACFMEPVGVITQKMESLNKSFYIGFGKVEEVKEAAQLLEAEVVIFDDTLTPSQLRNLRKALEKPVMDRTALILDIFETRARTREARLQVESAKLKYLLPRLVGMHGTMTRQGGTSGSMSSRGAGEKKLELDRRRIEHRIAELSRELKELSGERRTQRKKRKDARIPLVALVGYTNAGKSTIMNAMLDMYVKKEEKKVLEKDMLFATLDTTVRRISTGNHRDFLLSDTVGFIHKLPHDLVEAFHSTLEEVENADLLLQVVDYSDSHYREQADTTRETLQKLNAGGIPMITVYNKADKCGEAAAYPKRVGADKLYISARDASSIKLLADMILERVYEDYLPAEFLLPYNKGNMIAYFSKTAQVLSREYEEQGIRLKVKCHKADREKYREYLCRE